ncbi:MAG: spore gernimation protein GerA, partial [Paenibacillus sp.]|nr:spore gernimation protein GerA [Paenibacillus sp.]
MAIFKLLSRILLSRTRSSQNNTSNASTTHNPKPTLKHILSEFANCTDLTHRSFPDLQVDLVYFANMVGKEEFARDVIIPLDHT